jgi:hypothetical protein
MIFMAPPHGISAPVRQGAFVERQMPLGVALPFWLRHPGEGRGLTVAS